MQVDDLEVIWPRHKWHYLSPNLQDLETDMAETVTADPAPLAATGRELAARALVATACTQQRVSELLETSRRSVGRAGETDLVAALQDPTVVAEARTLLAASADRGSTRQERAAAETWLVQALRDERPNARLSRGPTAGRRTKTPAPKAGAKAAGRPKHGTPPASPTPGRPQHPVRVRDEPAPSTRAAPGLPLDALERQQQRILHRTQVIDYVLVAEQRNGATLTLGDALAELLDDISDAARTIGTILHPGPSRRDRA